LSTVNALGLVFICYAYTIPMSWNCATNGKLWLTLTLMIGFVLTCQIMLPIEGRLSGCISIVLSSAVGVISFIMICWRYKVFDAKIWSFLPFKK
ncbi:polysaccharide biosynthesis protein, partial [Streptococcus dysgalactiae]